jgi:protein AATF/BFR2
MEIGFKQYRDETIEKWNTKVQMSSGELAQKKFKVINQSVVDQIKTSMANPEKLIKRTQLNRSGIKVIGKVLKQKITPLDSEETSNNKHLDDFDSEIFDDGDYYQQLLKELIESRMSDTSDPVLLGLRYAQLKQLQKKKAKKNIDTRASKGRKVRYQVHEKIQNFMTPEPRGTWHDEMKNELFTSLFGKKDQRTDLFKINGGFKLF